MTSEKKMILSSTACQQIDAWGKRYPEPRSTLLEALRIVQEENSGWLMLEAIHAVADYLHLPRTAAYEVATFYSLYQLKPVGKQVIHFCRNIACLLCGADTLFTQLENMLGVRCPGTTADGQFTLQESECLGACIYAPVCQINKQYYEQLTLTKLEKILATLRGNEPHG